jgi:metal-dependent amidase/aminoacylase/carboxypeptidase family protein
VNIHGTKESKSAGGISMLAIRAEMDGLPMPEENPTLDYKTVTDHAHMCGHDGHMAMLLAATQVFQSRRHNIPST